MQIRNHLRTVCRQRPLKLVQLGWLLLLVVLARGASGQESLEKLTEGLSSANEKTKIQAIDSLARKGAAAKPAVKQLAASLGDQSAHVRAHVAHALYVLGPFAAEAAEMLAKTAAADPDPTVRRLAVQALSKVHSEPKVSIPALGKALEDKDPSVRVTALDALTSAGETAVPALTKALDNPATRYWAALALGELHALAKDAVPALSGALKDEHAETRREALVALARIGENASSAVPAIAPLLSDSDPSVRHAAAFALGHIGQASAGTLDALNKARQSQDPLMQTVAAWAVAHIEPKNEAVRTEVIGFLTKALTNKNPRVQGAALRGLVELEGDSAKLVPALSVAVTEGDPPLIDEALSMAKSIGPAGLPVLVEALKRPEATRRAAVLIGQSGPKAAAAIGALAATLDDQDAEVRREALSALASMGVEAAPAQTAIVKALNDPEVRVRTVAAYALGHIGAAASGAAPQLRAELESPDPILRVASAYALVHVSPRADQVAPVVVPVLMQGLKNENAAVRRGSAEALGRLGKAARNAESPLRAAARDSDDSVRKAALEALERMGSVIDAQPRLNAVPRR